MERTIIQNESQCSIEFGKTGKRVKLYAWNPSELESRILEMKKTFEKTDVKEFLEEINKK